jgi:gliding motility-associated-like protein
MKRLALILSATLACTGGARSQVVVEQGATLRLSRGAQLLHSNVSVAVEGELSCDSSTVVSFGGKDAPRLYAAHPLALHTLRIDGDATIDAGSLTVTGDIVLSGRGAARLQPATGVRLHGSILNETEEGYLTGGRIEKMLPALPSSGGRVATGMGMSFTAAQGWDSLLLTRTHEAWYYRGEYSISKAYELSRPTPLANLDITYLQAQSPKATDTYLIYYRPLQGQGLGLESVASETNAAAKRVTSKSEEPFEADRLTVFPFPDLGFPKSITPNGDGINDCFEVRGLEKFADARLVVLLPNGAVAYEASPYGNDFCGATLRSGTYYYMFFLEKGAKRPAKKGFFELVKE